MTCRAWWWPLGTYQTPSEDWAPPAPEVTHIPPAGSKSMLVGKGIAAIVAAAARAVSTPSGSQTPRPSRDDSTTPVVAESSLDGPGPAAGGWWDQTSKRA